MASCLFKQEALFNKRYIDLSKRDEVNEKNIGYRWNRLEEENLI